MFAGWVLAHEAEVEEAGAERLGSLSVTISLHCWGEVIRFTFGSGIFRNGLKR